MCVVGVAVLFPGSLKSRMLWAFKKKRHCIKDLLSVRKPVVCGAIIGAY